MPCPAGNGAGHLSDRKITSCAAASGGAQRSRIPWLPSGGRGEGDGVAEGFELADVAAGLAVLVDSAGVPGGAEGTEPGGAVGEQVPDDHQDRPGDGDQRLELSAAPGETAVPLAEEGAGSGGRGCGR